MKLRAAARRWAGVAVVGGIFIACDQVYADPVTTPFVPPRFDAGGLTTPNAPLSPCPRKEARENAPCAAVGSICEYGKSPDPKCNGTFVCASDNTYGLYWTEQTPGNCAFKCPESSAIVDGAPCELSAYGDGGAADEEELQCITELGTCACTTGPDAAHAHPRRWVCKKPDRDCPSERPRLGQICVGEHACDYGSCDFKRGARMICDRDVWQIEATPCK